MRGSHFAALLAAALLYPHQDSSAATVFRCVDANGHITFTRHGCKSDQEQQLQDARNPTPSSHTTIPLADTRRREQRSPNADEVVIVGQQDDGCGNLLSSSDRRQAIIRREIRSGMSRADVESSLGKPDRITQQNGKQRYYYDDTRGKRQQVNFDEAGCVKK